MYSCVAGTRLGRKALKAFCRRDFQMLSLRPQLRRVGCLGDEIQSNTGTRGAVGTLPSTIYHAGQKKKPRTAAATAGATSTQGNHVHPQNADGGGTHYNEHGGEIFIYTLKASLPCIARWLFTITHSPGSRRMRATIAGSLTNVQQTAIDATRCRAM